MTEESPSQTYVVKRADCPLAAPGQGSSRSCNGWHYECDGCLLDGTRLDVETRIEVEPAGHAYEPGVGRLPLPSGRYWVQLPPLSDPSTDSKEN